MTDKTILERLCDGDLFVGGKGPGRSMSVVRKDEREQVGEKNGSASSRETEPREVRSHQDSMNPTAKIL